MLQFSDSFAPYVSHYLEQNYGNRDFILRLALEGRATPIDWWEEIANGNVTEEEREVTEDAKVNFGIQHGLSIPVLSGSFAIAGISVISMNKDINHFRQLKHDSIDALIKQASGYHTSITMSEESMRFFIEPLLERLNETKRKVLKHLMSGAPMKTIPDTAGISQRYAEKVVLGLKQEFGDISTNELIYILGMVQIHKYL
jgi:hypothetical protein